ncbi:MAG: hypothetical protein VXX85_01930, partial [Candidatus Margulisiibacteriota bacterium]|nr:hypothetical protein [Candidatus Margulisiibacteriota bacterium]
GMGKLVNLSRVENKSERLSKIEQWLKGDGRKYYLETLDTPGFNTDNLPMEALIHQIQDQLSQYYQAKPQSSKMDPPRLVSHISSSQSVIQSGDRTTMVNISDISKIGYVEAESDLLNAALSMPDIGVANGFTDFDKPFTLIYKSNEDLNQSPELQSYIEQYKRLRDAVFKDMKPITAVNSGGHWSYVEHVTQPGAGA